MAILKVANMGNPVLRHEAEPVTSRDLKSLPVQQLIDDMIDTLYEYHGVGLAGPQVHECKRIILVDRSAGEDPDGGMLVLVNPVVTEASDATEEDWEGCLSIPDIRGRVPRASQIVVESKDRKGRDQTHSVSGFTARIMQHEIDHLDGVLFLDRMTDMLSLTFLPEYGRYWTDDAE
ncbi:peptide deformylase [Candidatus Poribacteria bacterium]|jgi:peptide deformylase|nr:peptide deformylase [Candidatus Poribacteria bacterium]MBT5533761.1 peptide deformylase [Candidatus Poribacteria bacterium]MBT5711498.1 peptide deformylase [Candidatus Poribacteria bacterium]MBT7100624.1 peptide deformylase [Candidatus Poribacteria bacterium]MBT7806947.1 peptide deformylase [Candidatus Poribacteria bacterium]